MDEEECEASVSQSLSSSSDADNVSVYPRLLKLGGGSVASDAARIRVAPPTLIPALDDADEDDAAANIALCR